MKNYNTSHQKITHDTESNASVTLDSNALLNMSKQDRQFIKTALTINQIDRRPFCVHDFKLMSKGNFRQKLHRNRQLIEIVKKGKPTFYKIKGIELPGDSHHVTHDRMGVGQKFIDILDSIKLQNPSIHDIKIKFESDLHQSLINKGCTADPSNNSIKVNSIPTLDSNITTKILVYPKITQIDISCTYKPLIYDVSGILQLTELLSKISYHLAGLSGLILPLVREWVITHYHFAKDGPEINGQGFHLTFEEVVGGLLRFYSKKMQDGSTIPRLEQIRTPKKTLAEELQTALEVAN